MARRAHRRQRVAGARTKRECAEPEPRPCSTLAQSIAQAAAACEVLTCPQNLSPNERTDATLSAGLSLELADFQPIS
jgi:hypothetical protein